MNQVAEVAPDPVAQAFAGEMHVNLDSGKKVRVMKWSVRKGIAMAQTLTELTDDLIRIVQTSQEARYKARVQEAEQGGEAPPNPDQYMNVGKDEILSALPSLLSVASERVATVVHESLKVGKAGTPQASMEEIMGEGGENPWTIEDFITVFKTIVEQNVTNKLIKKIKDFLKTGQRVMKAVAKG